ncbi:ABC transporter permease [Streptomyces sp. NPDC007369]|uniref:ABC transporter permease n=1 Tax=Streptomyces sp. NPDC007369 TaxID=3154589 RepID=UPI0033FA4CD1
MLHRTNGLARAALRFRPAAFAGTFLALLLTVAVVSACGILLATGVRASAQPARYAAAPVVVAADQQARLRVGNGEGAYDFTAPIPDRARVDAALLERLAPLGRAVPDVVFPVRVAAGGGASAGGRGAEVEASGWGSSAFTGTQLSAGRAPQAPGEVVTGTNSGSGTGTNSGTGGSEAGTKSGTGGSEAGTKSGTGGSEAGTGSGSLSGPAAAGAADRLVLDTPVGKREFRVVGHAEGTGVWFSDTEARALSGHPDALDAVVLLAPGDPEALAAKARTALDGRARVLTGPARAVAPDIDGAKALLTGLGGSFGGIATLVAVFTAAGTVALSVGQRSREFALLRALGATPRQIRRTVATEALLVAPAAGVLGCVPGTVLAAWWFGQLKEKGAIPAGVDLAVSWLPLASAVAIGLGTALLAGWAAARRPARIRPSRALAEAAVERLRPGWIRTPLGVAALAGGIACAGLAATSGGNDAAGAALGVVMLFMLAVALLGPLVARACTAVLGLPLRAAGAPGALAAANSRTHARRLASAITPIVLAMAFSSTLVFLHTSEERATRQQQEAGLLADHVVLDPASDAAGGLRVTRTAVLAEAGSGEDRHLETASALGVSGNPAAVLDLGVREGSLDRLTPGTVAVDRTLAASARVSVGDRIALRLPDGTPARPEVVAVYTRGLGLGQVTLPAADLAGRTTAGRPTELLVRGPAPADAGPALPAAQWTAQQATDRALNAWANTVMAAVLGGFAAIAAANTLVMTVLDRRRELRMLRLVGSTRRQVLRMVRWEGLLIGGAGTALGSAIALATLIPLTRAVTGEPPHIPPALYASFAAAALGLGLAATALPARWALRPERH